MCYDPDEIRCRIEALEREIQELRSTPVLSPDGDVISYADLEAY